jgi:ribosomal protein L40E
MNPEDRKTRMTRRGGVLIGVAFLIFLIGWIPGFPYSQYLGPMLALIMVLSFLGGVILLVMGLTSKPQPTEITKAEVQPSSQEVIAPKETLSLSTCPSCGAQNPADNNFCDQCGTKLSE